MSKKILLLRCGMIGIFAIVLVSIVQQNIFSTIISYITGNIFYIYHAKMLFKANISSNILTLALVDFVYDSNMMFGMGLLPIYVSVNDLNTISIVLLIVGFIWTVSVIYIISIYFKEKRYVDIYSNYGK